MNRQEITIKAETVTGLGGMTVNERLALSGLMDLFDSTKNNNKEIARFILIALKVDEPSINRILN
ncbi:MAG: hypothetical protein OCD76_25760 [Reichenbachiella sp.]